MAVSYTHLPYQKMLAPLADLPAGSKLLVHAEPFLETWRHKALVSLAPEGQGPSAPGAEPGVRDFIALECDAAVSYTHLDVYKRQPHGRAGQRGQDHPSRLPEHHGTPGLQAPGPARLIPKKPYGPFPKKRERPVFWRHYMGVTPVYFSCNQSKLLLL